MPRSRERVSEVPQRQKVPLHLRTSSSESDPLHQRPIVDRSPKLGERRSPRGFQSDSLHQKKLGTRVADLESQLGHAQDELKKLKDQLASTEAAKKVAQEELEKKKKEPVIIPESEDGHNVASQLQSLEIEETNAPNTIISTDSLDENSSETDVFEVPMATVLDKNMTTPASEVTEEEDKESKTMEIPSQELLSEVEKPSEEDMTLLRDEINLLKAKLEEKDKEVEVLQLENLCLNNKVKEMEGEITLARVKEEESEVKLTQTGVELEATKVNMARMTQEMETVVKAKEALESEMKTLRVQTEQWRKAADAAAAVLSGGLDMNGKFAGRCGSMDKHVVGGGGVFELPGAYTGYEGSPLMGDDLDDRYGNGKRKGSGIRMFGDLWKKKGQK